MNNKYIVYVGGAYGGKEENKKLIEDAIKCTKCGKVYYTLDKLIYDKNKTIKGRNNG